MSAPTPDPAHSFSLKVPDGDNRERRVCDTCGFIDYVNPRIVVGAVVALGDHGPPDGILLCRRAIEPRRGFWTIPAGYLEQHESPEAGARREALEEAEAEIELTGLLGVYSVPRISQVQLIYRARLRTPHFGAGEESLDVRAFRWSEIPWDALAFPSVHWALGHYATIRDAEHFPPFANPA